MAADSIAKLSIAGMMVLARFLCNVVNIAAIILLHQKNLERFTIWLGLGLGLGLASIFELRVNSLNVRIRL